MSFNPPEGPCDTLTPEFQPCWDGRGMGPKTGRLSLLEWTPPPTTMIPFLGYHPLYRLESERVGRVTSLDLSVLAVKQVQPSAVSKSVF